MTVCWIQLCLRDLDTVLCERLLDAVLVRDVVGKCTAERLKGQLFEKVVSTLRGPKMFEKIQTSYRAGADKTF